MLCFLLFVKPGQKTRIRVKYKGRENYKTVAELFRMARAADYRIRILTVHEEPAGNGYRDEAE